MDSTDLGAMCMEIFSPLQSFSSYGIIWSFRFIFWLWKGITLLMALIVFFPYWSVTVVLWDYIFLNSYFFCWFLMSVIVYAQFGLLVVLLVLYLIMEAFIMINTSYSYSNFILWCFFFVSLVYIVGPYSNFRGSMGYHSLPCFFLGFLHHVFLRAFPLMWFN